MNMTRDEWYESNNFRLLRLLNHYVASFGETLQEIWDIMELVAAMNPDCGYNDKTTILQQQMRIMQEDAKALWAAEREWERLFSPTMECPPGGDWVVKGEWEKGENGYWKRKKQELPEVMKKELDWVFSLGKKEPQDNDEEK